MSLPTVIDGARVLLVADLANAATTGKIRHAVDGVDVTNFAGLAIAKYEDEESVYLLYCDEDWQPVTDTYHESVAAAIEQANFEYRNFTFVEPNPDSDS